MDIKKTSVLRNIMSKEFPWKVDKVQKGSDQFIPSSFKNLDSSFIKYYNLVSQASDIRLDKVESVKQKLRDNAYQSRDIEALAEKIIRFLD